MQFRQLSFSVIAAVASGSTAQLYIGLHCRYTIRQAGTILLHSHCFIQCSTFNDIRFDQSLLSLLLLLLLSL